MIPSLPDFLQDQKDNQISLKNTRMETLQQTAIKRARSKRLNRTKTVSLAEHVGKNVMKQEMEVRLFVSVV